MLPSAVTTNVLFVSIFLSLASEIHSQASSDGSQQQNRFRSCSDSGYCTPIRKCPSLRDGWKRKGVGVTCGYGSGPYRKVCCPRVQKQEVPTRRTRRPIAYSPIPPAHRESIKASPDDTQPQNRFRSCSDSGYCTPILKCPSLRDGWKRRGVGVTCGEGSGPHRRVCCPRVQKQEAPTRRPVVYSPTPPPADSESVKDCGLSQGVDWFKEQITDDDDDDAIEATWPWMVAIRFRKSDGSSRFWCSGFLIDRTHVLSAAHCFRTNRQEGNFSAHIGSDDLDSSEEYPIIHIKPHERYTDAASFHNDIALLTLAREVNFTHFVPVCLPDDRLAAMDITGWGSTLVGWGSEALDDPTSDTLKQLDNVPIVSNEECDQIFKERFGIAIPLGITDRVICAGQTEFARNSCKGDSGGPLMILHRKRWFAVGLTSFGVSCGLPGVPSVFTRIANYSDWIRKNVENGSNNASATL